MWCWELRLDKRWKRPVLSTPGLPDTALEREGMRGAWGECVSGLLLMSAGGVPMAGALSGLSGTEETGVSRAGTSLGAGLSLRSLAPSHAPLQ